MAELGLAEFGWDIGWPTLTELYAAWLGWDWLGLAELDPAGFMVSSGLAGLGPASSIMQC